MTETTRQKPTATQPLLGLRVLEMSTMITASMAAMILASQGAEVIKVEPVGIGDTMRHLGAGKPGMSGLFANCNRGKKSIAVDLKKPAGRDLVMQLATNADVLVHNYRPGVMDSLGLGSDVMRELNKKLIYVSITGFGAEGPLKDQGAYDPVLQAMTGLTVLQGGDGGEPDFVRTLICDKVTALTASQAITAALLARATTGEGQHIELSMLEACLFFIWPDGMMDIALLEDDITQAPTLAANYSTRQTADGHIALSAITDAHFSALYDVIGRPDMNEDPRFSTMAGRMQNVPALQQNVNAAFVKMTTDDLVAKLVAADVPVSACVPRDKVRDHPQVRALNAIIEQQHPVLGRLLAPSPAPRFGNQPGTLDAPAPRLGEHTGDVLQALGKSDADIAQLTADRVVAG